MLRKMADLIFHDKRRGLSFVVAVCLGFYLVGVTAPLIIALVVVFLLGLQFPSVIKTVLSKFIFSVAILYSVIQVAATVQFLAAPHSDFRLLVSVTSVLSLLLIFIFPSEKVIVKSWRDVINRNDILALICAGVFVIPFLLIVVSGNGAFLEGIGAIQGIDGINHFASIAEMSSIQHFGYTVGNYYPNGFHIATALVQTGVGIVQSNFTWLTTAKIYMMQNAVFGGGLLYALYYLFIVLKNGVFKKGAQSISVEVAAALSIGTVISILYFTTFLYHGFLSYFYICAAMFFGLFYLFDVHRVTTDFARNYKLVALFLLTTLGASMSWPLWTPAILLIAGLFVLFSYKMKLRAFTSPAFMTVLATVLLHFIPIYFQIKYTSGDSSQGINLTGGLHTFHYGVILAGLALFVSILLSRYTTKDGRQQIQLVCVPLLILLSLIVCMQYFVYNEIRYYSIKTSLFVEMFFIVLFVAAISTLLVQHIKELGRYIIITVPLVVFMGVVLLLSMSGGPFQDARLLFRGTSVEPKPAYFDNDTKKLSILGEENKIHGINTISLHVNAEGKLFTHMQAFYWSDMMEYDGTTRARSEMATCNGMIYGNLFRQDFSDKQQEVLINTIKSCAAKAKAENVSYYIVTDDKSKDRLNVLFGSVVNLI